MKIITNRNVMNEIDNIILSNSDIHEIELDNYETNQFLGNVARLVDEGTLTINIGDYNTYVYNGVTISMHRNVLLG